MIVNTALAPVPTKYKSAMDFVRESDLNFHLTGSRFFGNDGLNSDYDYFVQDGLGVQYELMRAGFVHCMDESYCDKNTTYVFRKDDVHIQLTKDVEKKIKAQRLIFASDLSDRLSKEDRKTLWNLVYAAMGS